METRVTRIVRRICQIPGASFVARPIIKSGKRVIEESIRSHAPELRRDLEYSKDVHFLDEPTDKNSSEWIVWSFVKAHRQAFLHILEAVPEYEKVDLGKLISLSISELEAIQHTELENEISEKIRMISDPVTQAALRYLFTERDANLSFLQYLRDRGLTDLDPRNTFINLPEITFQFEEGRKRVLRSVIEGTTSRVLREVGELTMLMRGSKSHTKSAA